MRLSKMLGLTALAALAVMAIAGAGTAFAKGLGTDTVLCSANQHPCAAGNIKPSGTVISAESANAVLKVSFFGAQEVSCESTVEGETKEAMGQKGASGTELEGKITSLTFTSCELISTHAECTVTTLQLPYQALLEQEASTGSGHLFVFEGSAASGQPGAIVECPGIIAVNCIYKGNETNAQKPGVEGVNLQANGGNPGSVVANQAVLKEVSIPPHTACTGSGPRWDGNYTVTAPNPLWVSHA